MIKRSFILILNMLVIALTCASSSSITLKETQAMSYKNNYVKIPVFMYHHFDRDVSNLNSTTVSPEEFEDHVRTLIENGYSSISLSEFYNYVKNKSEIPGESFILTIDDGYSSNYFEAFPILKKYNLKAAISVVTSTVGKTPGKYPHFTWEQAKEMEDSGLIEIYNHTADHKDCSQMSKEELIKNADEAQNDIERNLGKRKVKVFTYPGGYFTKDTQKIIEELGFDIQMTVKEGVVTKSTPLNAIKRVNIGHGLSGKDIIHLIKKLENME